MRLIELIKTSKEETEDGYMFMPQDKVLEQLKISTRKLKKVMQCGLKNKLLKFSVIKEVKSVVYTQERRLSLSKHV